MFHFQFWMIIYVLGALICFTVFCWAFSVKKKPTQSRNLFGLLAIFSGTICIFDFLSQITSSTITAMYMQYIVCILYPFPVFLLMLIPLTLYKELDNRAILKLAILPLTIGLFGFVGGGINGLETGNFADIMFVKVIYDEMIYPIWLFLNLLPIMAMYYFFYKIFKSPGLRANRDFMKRMKVFVTAITLLITTTYAFAISEGIFGTPPLSSVGIAIGISLAMLAFKLRKEKM